MQQCAGREGHSGAEGGSAPAERRVGNTAGGRVRRSSMLPTLPGAPSLRKCLPASHRRHGRGPPGWGSNTTAAHRLFLFVSAYLGDTSNNGWDAAEPSCSPPARLPPHRLPKLGRLFIVPKLDQVVPSSAFSLLQRAWLPIPLFCHLSVAGPRVPVPESSSGKEEAARQRGAGETTESESARGPGRDGSSGLTGWLGKKKVDEAN